LECRRGAVSEITMETKIEQALQEIRPLLARHLGDIEFVKYENSIVYVRFLGTCHGCPLSTVTLKMGVEEMLKSKIPEIDSVEAV